MSEKRIAGTMYFSNGIKVDIFLNDSISWPYSWKCSDGSSSGTSYFRTYIQCCEDAHFYLSKKYE